MLPHHPSGQNLPRYAERRPATARHATRRARILRRAADVIEADLHGWPIAARDVSRLLKRPIPERDAQAIADVIDELWAPGRMGRDAETEYLRCEARAIILNSRRGFGGAR